MTVPPTEEPHPLWVPTRTPQRPVSQPRLRHVSPAARLLYNRGVLDGLNSWRNEQPWRRELEPTYLSLHSRHAAWEPPPGSTEAEYGQRFRPDFNGPRPLRGNWTVHVVIDQGWTMEMWRPVVHEFIDMLHLHAISATLKRYTLDSDTGTVTPAFPTQRTSSARELTIVLTDGLGPFWLQHSAEEMLCTWGTWQPLAVVHFLPRALWASSGIRAKRQALRPSAPAQANKDLQVEARDEDDHLSCPVPTLELGAEDLGAWGRLVVQEAPTLLYCIAAQPAAARMPGQTRSSAAADESVPDGQATGAALRSEALQQLELFRRSASREAKFLANALSVLPLNVAVMRRTQETLLPRHGPELFSELFIAHLIHPVVTAERLRRIDRVTFDFAPGVREELVAGLNQQWTGNLFTATAAFLDEDLGIPFVSSWRHLIDAPHRTAFEEATEVSLPFLRVELTVLEALSGPYRSRAKQLREMLSRFEQSSMAVAP